MRLTMFSFPSAWTSFAGPCSIWSSSPEWIVIELGAQRITICPLAVGLRQVRRQGKVSVVREVPLFPLVRSSLLVESKDHLIRPTLYKHKPAAWRTVTHRLYPPPGRHMHIHSISQLLVLAPSRSTPAPCFTLQPSESGSEKPRTRTAKGSQPSGYCVFEQTHTSTRS